MGVRRPRLGLVERGDAREDLALEELERRAAARGDVRHGVGEARLLDGGHGVAAADDRDGALLRELLERVADGEGALGEASISKTPMGPFQITVLQSASLSWIIFVAAGPLSRPIQPSGIASLETTWVFALASKASATRISFGKMSSQPFSSASFMASLAVWMKSSSTSDVPTFLPWALRKVKVMPPPTMTLSRFLMSDSRTVIFDETFVTPSVDACARWAVPKASLTKRSKGAASFSTKAASSLGRPRCEHIATLAPLSRRYLTVGTDARMRVSSPMTPSLMGTLRSQRMRTFLPLRSASERSATDFLASSSTGARTAALLTGAKAPAQESARARMTAFILSISNLRFDLKG